MPERTETQNTSQRLYSFVDYKPAEAKFGKDWMVVYWCKNPVTLHLKRFRVRVPVHSSITERRKMAKRMAAEINRKLETGWSPFIAEHDATFRSFEEVKQMFFASLDKEVRDGLKREETKRSYTSMLNLYGHFLEKYQRDVKYLAQVKSAHIVRYLDYLYHKGNSPVSYNNNLNFLKVFFRYALDRGFVSENPCATIRRKKRQEKKRQYIPLQLRQQIAEYLTENDPNFLIVCLMTYYTFIRATELTKLRVKDVNLPASIITINAKASKNGKTDTVTIPDPLWPFLSQHIEGANPLDYLFSRSKFQPGKIKNVYRNISFKWERMRGALGFGLEYSFYSLKDTGITDLLSSGIATVKGRDQARHHDLSMTADYYRKENKKADVEIKNSGVIFAELKGGKKS